MIRRVGRYEIALGFQSWSRYRYSGQGINVVDVRVGVTGTRLTGGWHWTFEVWRLGIYFGWWGPLP